MAETKSSGLDFAQIINSAMTAPDSVGAGKDLPDGFPMLGSQNHKVIDTSEDATAIPGVVAYDFKVHRKVFTIFRPWADCARCQNDIASQVETLPAEGDYTCPHTASNEYEVIVNDILAGKFVHGGEQEVNQKDGSIVISLRWFEKKLNHKRLRQMNKAAKNQQEEPPL